ncbi:transmembrane 220 family protein [Flavobacteriaceae bacterium XHP0103]|uniref:transmembrane 220 family protein n=1 Tax=Marixanthotalea marina TaxID=2844359 RepID=UPI002989A9A1|nr:transmembrane 220 family protein [Marixanthotalea marina]MBU3821293.1 transmembrane 220 family protein [Marixanthotalea marina]
MSLNGKLSRSKKVINIVFFVLFALFAIVQLNDPDPVHWFLIYGAVSVTFLLANYINIPKQIIWVFVLALLIYASIHIAYFFDWIKIDHKEEIFGEMVYEKPYLEGTREFLGLIIAALALLFLLKK